LHEIPQARSRESFISLGTALERTLRKACAWAPAINIIHRKEEVPMSPHILALDIAGAPHRWTSVRVAAHYYDGAIDTVSTCSFRK
jgi:hypothetical protein